VRCREAANAARQQGGRPRPLLVLVRADTRGGAESVEELQVMVVEDTMARATQPCRVQVMWEEIRVDDVQ